jgi:branched-chain amino acid transport system substrate-binding protein
MNSRVSWLAGFFLLAVFCCLPARGQAPVVVGAVVSQTGTHAALADGYRKGLLLWQEEVNAAGGLLGRKVDLRILDDASTASRNAALYEQLIGQERADLLIGPYGTAATLLAAASAERARHVLINGAGPGRAVHRRAPRFVFQTGVPYSAYGPALLALAEAEGLKRLFVLAHDDTAAKEMAEGLRAAAAGEVEVYRSDLIDFAPLVEKARAADAEAWIAFGGAREAADMLRTFRRMNYAPKMFFASGAADPKFIPLVGQDAEFSLTAIEYDPQLGTPGNERFVKAFTARWSAPPGQAAAEGYVAGTVAAAAVRRAGSLDQEKLRAALGALEVETVLGRQKMNPAGGAQTAARPALAQIRRGRPAVLAAGERPIPYPAWSERQVLK